MGQLRKWRRRHRAYKRELKRQGMENDKKHRVKRMRVREDNRRRKIERAGIEVHKQYVEPEWRRKLRERRQSKSSDTRDGC